MKKTRIKNIPLGPFPTAIVGAEVDGKPNYVTVGACGVVCQKPVLYVSVKNSHYTTPGIRANGFFSLNIPSAQMVSKTDYCGLVSGNSADKSKVFQAFYDEKGRAPLIEECPVNYLCKVIETIPVFDFSMFLGEIIAVYLDESCLSDGGPDIRKIDPLILMGTDYWRLDSRVGSVFKEGKAENE